MNIVLYNIYENKTKEEFENDTERSKGSVIKHVYSGFRCLLNIIALILAFTTNKEFNIGSVIVACCCPLFYIGLKTVKYFRKSEPLD